MLFDAIDGENLEAFKQALAEGADVNAFDKAVVLKVNKKIKNIEKYSI
jgi:hypothetical protein